MLPKLNRRRAMFVLTKIDEILACSNIERKRAWLGEEMFILGWPQKEEGQIRMDCEFTRLEHPSVSDTSQPEI